MVTASCGDDFRRRAEAAKAADAVLRALAEKAGAEPVAWMRRSVTYREGDGRMEGERIFSEAKVYADDVPLYTTPPSQPVALPDGWRAIAESVLSLSHAGDCRVWQYGADEDRCECGVKDAKAKASALLAAAPEVPR